MMERVSIAIEGKEVVALRPQERGILGYQMALTVEDGQLVQYVQTVGSTFGQVKFSALRREELGPLETAIKRFSNVAVLMPQQHYRPLSRADRNLLIG